MSEFGGQRGQLNVKIISVLSLLFLLIGFGTTIQYFKYLNCVGPLDLAVFVGNGLQIAAGVVGIKIVLSGESLGRYTTYLLVVCGIIGVLMVVADLLSRYQLGRSFGIGTLSIAGGMTAIGVIGVLTVVASRSRHPHQPAASRRSNVFITPPASPRLYAPYRRSRQRRW